MAHLSRAHIEVPTPPGFTWQDIDVTTSHALDDQTVLVDNGNGRKLWLNSEHIAVHDDDGDLNHGSKSQMESLKSQFISHRSHG